MASSEETELHRTGHSLYPCSTRLTIRQAQVDKLYAGLKELAGERRERLQEHLRLCQLRRELDDLEQWIQEREVVAASHELGQDYEHVTVSAAQIRAHRESRVLRAPDRVGTLVGFELYNLYRKRGTGLTTGEDKNKVATLPTDLNKTG